MLQFPVYSLKGGNSNIIRLKSLCSAVWFLHFDLKIPTGRRQTSWLFTKPIAINNEIRKNDYQMAHLLIFSRKYPFLCQHFMVFNFEFFNCRSCWLPFLYPLLVIWYVFKLSTNLSDTKFRGKVAWDVKTLFKMAKSKLTTKWPINRRFA